MVMAIVQADDAPVISESLVAAGYRVTRIATTGGWLRRENTTLLLGVDDERVNHVIRVLQGTARRRTTYISMPLLMPGVQNAEMTEVEIGGATVFVLDVEQFERF
ncbi:MAG: cyclic-di-AMP receptor [Chloroflexi bacterium]|nr:cyclic-di-AMP receptor [Chloroflexota bacterium]